MWLGDAGWIKLCIVLAGYGFQAKLSKSRVIIRERNLRAIHVTFLES